MAISAKEKILSKISKALATPTPDPFPEADMQAPLYAPVGDDLAVAFAEQFIQLQGQFSYCMNMADLQQQLSQLIKLRDWQRLYCADDTLRQLLPFEWFGDLATCQVAITGCELLVARTGSIVLSAAQAQGRTASVYAPSHICIAYGSQLVADISDALEWLQRRYKGNIPSMISFANGPSRTADIEKTLVTGVHGPREVFCFLMED